MRKNEENKKRKTKRKMKRTKGGAGNEREITRGITKIVYSILYFSLPPSSPQTNPSRKKPLCHSGNTKTTPANVTSMPRIMNDREICRLVRTRWKNEDQLLIRINNTIILL